MPTSTPKAARWPALVFFLYLAVQVAVPVYCLFKKPPVRFGWQMFSASSVPDRLWVVSAEGTREIAASAYIGNYRSDLDWERYAPPQLCRAVPNSQVIRYLMPHEDTAREYRC